MLTIQDMGRLNTENESKTASKTVIIKSMHI